MQNRTLTKMISAAAFTAASAFSMNLAAGQIEETSVQLDPSGLRIVRLQYSPADLATEAGRKEMHRRIARAAKQVCGPLDRLQAGSLGALSRNRQCYNTAVEAAVSQLNSGQVATIDG